MKHEDSAPEQPRAALAGEIQPQDSTNQMKHDLTTEQIPNSLNNIISF